MFKPFSIREIYRYMVPGILLFCMIYLIINSHIKWCGITFFEKIIVVLISSAILGMLLEPIMTLLGIFILKYHEKLKKNKIAKYLLRGLNTTTLETNVNELLFKGIWIVIEPEERELLWHSTATYYLYGSFSLILFFNGFLIWLQFLIGDMKWYFIVLISFFSFVLFYASLKQLIVYLEITNSYLSYISRKHKEKIKDLLSPENFEYMYKDRTTRLHKITQK